MPVEIILDRLQKVRKSGSGKWMACCPAHEDKSPSLMISERSDGFIGIHCFAGCSAENVMSSLDLTMTQLFPEVDQHSLYRTKPNYEARYHRTQIKRSEEELELMKNTLIFYEQDIKAGKKFTPEQNKRYLEMFKQVKQNEKAA